MNLTFKVYTVEYQNQLEKLFDDFQDYLVDLDPLKRLRRPKEYGAKTLAASIKEVSKNEGFFCLALDKEKVVGFAIGTIHRLPADYLDSYPDSHGHITELYVDPEYRGSGIGTRLVARLEEYFKQKGCNYSWVEVFVPNINAHQFYKKCGYQDREIEMIKSLKD